MKRGRPPRKYFNSNLKRTKIVDQTTDGSSSIASNTTVEVNLNRDRQPITQEGNVQQNLPDLIEEEVSYEVADRSITGSAQRHEESGPELIVRIVTTVTEATTDPLDSNPLLEEETNETIPRKLHSRNSKTRATEHISKTVAILNKSRTEERFQYFDKRRSLDVGEYHARRLQNQRRRDALRRAEEETEDRAQRLEGQRRRDAIRRADEEVEDRAQRLEGKRRRDAIRRAEEEVEDRAQRLEGKRRRDAIRRAEEEVEDRAQRLEGQRRRDAIRRAEEEVEDRAQRLEGKRRRDAIRRAEEEVEDRAQRLEGQRRRDAIRRADEEVEDRAQRLEGKRRRDAIRRAEEEVEDRAQRLEGQRRRDALRRAEEEVEDRAQRLEDQRRRVALRRADEEVDDRAQRLEGQRQRDAIRRADEEVDDRAQRLEDQRRRDAIRRVDEEVEDRAQRLEGQRRRDAIRRADEEVDDRSERLEGQRQRDALRRSTEEGEERADRLKQQRRRTAANRLRPFQIPSYKVATTNDVEYSSLGMFNIACFHCGAVHFVGERVQNRVHINSFGDCCLHGRIEQPPPTFPNELALLFSLQHPLGKPFHDRIRSICACFAFASFNVADDRTFNSKGIYTFTVGGQVYHKMNMAAQPTLNDLGELERPRYGQMYFIDQDAAVLERVNEPVNRGINQNLMEILEEIMRSQNPFAQAYTMMREVIEETNERCTTAFGTQPPKVHLVFAERAGDDPRRFNAQSCNEVAAIITLNADQSIPENEMLIKERGKHIVTLKNTDSRIEPFTYPIFFPNGTFGYSVGLSLKIPYASRAHMTRMEFAQYRLAFRPRLAQPILDGSIPSQGLDLRELEFNALHFGGRLFQQYVVDTFIRVERDRIQWIKANQKKLLADHYAGVTQFLNNLAEKKKATIGEHVILPSSFPGSTRFYTEHFEDAMAIVRRFGSPDFFITVTCSPTWPELKEAACITLSRDSNIQQLAQDRPDLVARIAKLKFDEIVENIYRAQIFGKSSAYVYTIEFQKRGLPHLHLLVIMSQEDKLRSPDEVDALICAEIPNDDMILRNLVLKWMIHNPCGDQNPNATCMDKKSGSKKCRFGFPKAHQEHTSILDDKKPCYRRRYNQMLDPNHPAFSHTHAVYRNNCDNKKITRDNRHVAPYNGYLLKKFMCHINVEYVGSIRAVKYLYKYIYKGHDCANIKIIENETRIMYNEPETFVEARYISPPEACWRLFGNEIQKKSHAVQRLDIHLPGMYRTIHMDQTHEDLADTGLKGSTLDAYFRHNEQLKRQEENGVNVTYCYYWQMPESYKWVGKTSEWILRQRASNTIGRVHTVNCIAQPELYHLRMLLFHVKGSTSFQDLKIVDGVTYPTYKRACLARGLTYDDRQWIDGLRESSTSKMPRVMRTLFAQILIMGSPENPKLLWDMFKKDLAEDFLREAETNGTSTDEAIKKAYRIIAYKLNTEATEGRGFQFWVNNYDMDDIDNYESENNQEDCLVNESAAIGNRYYNQLNEMQKQFVDAVLDAINDHRAVAKCFFLDGPGGTGKTFVYNTLHHIIRGRNLLSKCMAFTGIAAILLPEGRTTHKTFGLKVPLTSDSTSSIKQGSGRALELSGVDVFMMDEAPMLPKYGLGCIDQLLKGFGNNRLPFGGKIVILGGDFRQCLPVQPRANRTELIDLSIKQSHLWPYFRLFSLQKNMRVDVNEIIFANYLLKLGNGELDTNHESEIELPEDIISNGDIIHEIYGPCLENGRFEEMKERAILAPLNKEVDAINTEVINILPGEEKIYYSLDTTKDEYNSELRLPTEFLNSVDISDLPPHQLRLKKNVIVMLLRNVDVSEGLCNGTRLIITDLCEHIIKAKIVTGENSGRDVHIPRITLDSSKSQLGCTLQRHQFPVRPAFAMTIHKSQGQTFQSVGVVLKTPVFMHGMLYVAFSRVKRHSGLKVVLPSFTERRTRNMVWQEILN